jgi:hypothetical protein
MKTLLFKKITKVRQMTKKEAEQFGWYKRPWVIQLEDGTFIIPQSDDEGNDGGAALVINPDGTDHLLYTDT